MLSMPPARTTLALPAASRSLASITAFMPDPHTLLMVVAPVPSARPALRIAWRAGACPSPAGSTLPMITSSTAVTSTPACATARAMAQAPRSTADSGASSPWKAPMGVRVAATM